MPSATRRSRASRQRGLGGVEGAHAGRGPYLRGGADGGAEVSAIKSPAGMARLSPPRDRRVALGPSADAEYNSAIPDDRYTAASAHARRPRPSRAGSPVVAVALGDLADDVRQQGLGAALSRCSGPTKQFGC
jgi:hypothetical protein